MAFCLEHIVELSVTGLNINSDLNSLLGQNWHYRELNVNGDCGYAVQDTRGVKRYRINNIL